MYFSKEVIIFASKSLKTPLSHTSSPETLKAFTAPKTLSDRGVCLTTGYNVSLYSVNELSKCYISVKSLVTLESSL